MNIKESNKLIAEFMAPNSTNYPESAKYHNSWDWLMPVVEKIMDICYEEDSEGIYVDQDLIEKFLKIRDTIPEIHNTYKAIVEFIKWHNNERTKTKSK